MLSAALEPAEASPGEAVSLSALIVDPDGLGVERALAWTCTDLGEGCAEALLATRASEWAMLGPVEDETFEASFTVPEVLSAVFAEGLEELELPLYVLACAPGACPVLDAVAEDPAAGSAEFEAVAELLGDPEGLVSGLAMDQACLGTRELVISLRPEEEREHNPVLFGPDDLSLVAGETEELIFSIGDSDSTDGLPTLILSPYSTAGTFDDELIASEAGDLPVEFNAPEELSDLGLYAVLRDGTGGQAWWRAELDGAGQE